ncbi:Kef-type K+ transport system membrane component KefB [Catenulispora sp. GAS73]|uniref:cation:proton antiporter n=1 Tax=Catenulispora sp. GAS73 TaxID=3156269 RepID=UPI0035178E27
MTTHSLGTLVLVAVIAVLSPPLADLAGRRAPVPLVVFEIVLGILVGPDVLGWAHDDDYVHALSQFGLAMLFFMAGYEIDFARLRGGPLNRALAGWAVSVALGVGLGVLVAPTAKSGVIVGIALSTTALGTILPVLRDAGEVGTPLGNVVMAVGAVGEFAPIIAMTLFLDGRKPGEAMVYLTAFVLIAGVGIVVAVRGEHAAVNRLADLTMETSGQFAVRLVIALLLLMIGATVALGVDMLLGAFAAGVIMRILFHSGDAERAERVTAKLEAVGFGFLIPVFFIETGIGYDLKALTSNWATLGLVPLFLGLFLVTRGVPSFLSAPDGVSARGRRAIALYAATGLPLIVAITAIGVDRGTLKASTAAAMVGAGMLSVLLYPFLALKVSGDTRTAQGREEAAESW